MMVSDGEAIGRRLWRRQIAAHLTDQVLPRVPYRQWVLSAPKRIRWHLREKPQARGGVRRVFLRAVETTLQ